MTQHVLITGAATGIGMATAHAMDALGWNVIAGVLPGEDTTALRAETSDRLRLLELDITDPEQVTAARRQVESWTGDKLDGLVNNAGVGASVPVEVHPMPHFRRVIEVNLLGHVQVIQAMTPLLRNAGGRMVNVASVLGLVGAPSTGAYSASKFAMIGLSEALRAELKPQGMHVAIITPGYIQTPIWQRARSLSDDLDAEIPEDAMRPYRDMLDQLRSSSDDSLKQASPPSHVAEAIVHALTSNNPRARYAVGHRAAQVKLISMLPTRLRDWLLLRSI